MFVLLISFVKNMLSYKKKSDPDFEPSLYFTNVRIIILPPPETAVSRKDRKKRLLEQKVTLKEVLIVKKEKNERESNIENETSSQNNKIDTNISGISSNSLKTGFFLYMMIYINTR